MGNPVHQYNLIERFVVDLPTLQRTLEDDVAAQIIGEWMTKMYEVDPMDLVHATQNLMRIGEIYR